MIRRVLFFVRQHHMIESGNRVLAGVSGGADSMCLLLALLELRQELEFELFVAHVEHGIRGKASLDDAAFVQDVCARKKVPCYVEHCDVPAFAKQHGMSLEEAARELRYQCLEQVRREVGADKIAVAHNQNDCAETLLFQLVRGCGLRGAGGIAPVRGNVIRPLLFADRREIEAFLEKQQQDFCQDMTNFEMDYSRNKIRHQALPALVDINAKAVEHLYRSAELFSQAGKLLEQLANKAEEDCLLPGPTQSQSVILRKNLLEQPALVQQTVVLRQLERLVGSRKDLGAVHVDQVLALFERQVGRGTDLPEGIRAKRAYEGIALERKEEEMNQLSGEWTILPGVKVEIEEKDICITANILENSEEFYKIPQKRYTKWFDYDKIKNSLLVRSRRQGDYFVLDGKGSRQKLKKYFINEKIPAQKREDTLLLAEGSHILWVIGYRISEAYKVTKGTKRVLEVQISGGNMHE